MPKVADAGPYRLFFFSNERSEPPHVHVERDDKLAKFWLRPVELADAGGFGASELRKIRAIVIRFEDECWDRWHAYFKRAQND